MTAKAFSSPAFAGLIVLALPACASSTPSTATSSSVGLDLGPSSRIPTTQIAMLGAGHEAPRLSQVTASNVQPVHEGGSDAHATGTVNSVDAAQHKINLSHQPIPAIGWPAMTMEFPVAPSVDLSRIKAGSRVNFSLEKDKGGMYQIQSVEPAGAGR